MDLSSKFTTSAFSSLSRILLLDLNYLTQQCFRIWAAFKLRMKLGHVELYKKAYEITRVRQEKSLNVLIRLDFITICWNASTDHLIDILEHSVDSTPLLLLLDDISKVIKGDTL